MPVTSVDIDPELLREAKAVLGATTTKAVVDQALREVILRSRQLAALDELATLDLELSPTKITDDD
jgi:Arc/MetJ family transcription regulator